MIKRRTVLTGCLLLALIVAFASPRAGHAGCEQGDCTNGPGRYVWPDGSSYTGDFLKGKFHGQGTYAWSDGKKYTGGFENDKRNGIGTYTWPNGANYRGEWENGKKAGYGIYTFPDGRKSIGLWENGALSQEMEENEVLPLLAPKPVHEAQAAAAAVTPAQTAPEAAASTPSADAELDKQLAALGGQTEAAAPDEGKRRTVEKAPASEADSPFDISVQKLVLVKGSRFNTWEKVPLLAAGPIMPIGTCSVKASAESSDTAAGKLMVTVKIANHSGCPLSFAGFIQAGDYYVKVVSWSGDQAIAPGSAKEISRAVALEKDAPRSEIVFKLQGAGCPR